MKFAIFCKSFRDDLHRFARLADSVVRHNRDRLPFYASVPRSDRLLFAERIGSRDVELVCDEDILGEQVKQSWTTQQLVKLCVGRTGFADAWFWLDSDAYFIRDFGLSDFVRDDGSVAFAASRKLHLLEERWTEVVRELDDPSTTRPLTLAELGGASASHAVAISRWQRWVDAVLRPSFEARLPRIASFFGRTGPSLYYLPGAIWTQDGVRSFEEAVLAPLRMTFSDLLQYAPWEANWIGEWTIASGMRGRHIVESPFLHIRSDEAIRRARREGLGESRLAARYLGLQLAARHQEYERLDELRSA